MSDTSDLRQLYQEVILDHARKPRNFGRLEAPSRQAEGINPLCGDELTLTLDVTDGVIRDIRFQGKGCAISTASASLMAQALKGRSTDEANALFERFHRIVTSPPEAEVDLASVGKLAALAGVREFPLRVKCASLAWHTLRAALEGSNEPVTTE